MRRKGIACAIAVTLLLAGPLALPAHAYVDPGTGSFIFQAVIGGVLAAVVAVKVFWKKITGAFSRGDEASSSDE